MSSPFNKYIYIEIFNITTRIRTQGLWGYGSVGQLLYILYFYLELELGAERFPGHILVLKSWILGKVD
jgi:hypothetical protein